MIYVQTQTPVDKVDKLDRPGVRTDRRAAFVDIVDFVDGGLNGCPAPVGAGKSLGPFHAGPRAQ